MKPIKSVCISYPLGCPRSKVDAALLIDYFKANDWRLTTKFGKADFILIGSCAVTQETEEQSFEFFSILNRKRKTRSRVFVFGCIAGISGQQLLVNYDFTPLTPSSLKNLDLIINAKIGIESIDVPCNLEIYDEYLTKSFSATENYLILTKTGSPFKFLQKIITVASSPKTIKRFKNIIQKINIAGPSNDAEQSFYGQNLYSLRVSRGCLENCSYCAIRFCHDTLSSVSLEKILQSFDEGLNHGFTVFRLIGEDIGAYGQDLGYTIVDLLKEMFIRKGIYKIIFDDFHPKWLIKYFPDLHQLLTINANKIDYMGFPIQSGSDRILTLMKREYKIANVIKCIQDLRATAPNLIFKTHIIVGFPGETDADFTETLELLKILKFSKVTIFKYSDRPGAPSAEYTDKISNNVIIQRTDQIEALSSDISP